MSEQFDNCTLTVLDRVDSIGLAFVVEAGLLSASSLALLSALLVRNVLRYKKYASAYKWSLVQQPADVYVLSLFFADVLQSIGASMSARWVHDGTVTAGGFCTAQGIIQQLGETSVGLATMLIAIHTFMGVWMRKQHSVRTAVIIVAVSWTFIALFVGIASGLHKNYDEPSPFWCWVGPGYRQERIWGEYFWLWLTLFVAIAVYLPLFLWNQGYITIDEQYWWKVKWYWRATGEDGEMRERPRASSLAILAYPVAYSAIVLPVSIVRWITFTDQKCGDKAKVPTAATFATVFLHDSFGFVNVLLLLMTRQTLLLFDDPRNQRQVRLRRAAGGALEDGDDNVQLNVHNADAHGVANGGAHSPAPSSSESFLGVRRAASGTSNGNNSATGDRFHFNDDDMDADASIEMRMREIVSPPTSASPFHEGEASSSSLSRMQARTSSQDSGRDVLGIVTRDRKGSGGGASVLHPLPSPSERRPGSATSRDNAYNSGRPQPPQREGSGTTQHGPANLMGRLHSKTSSSGSRRAEGGADEYSDDEIARRLAELTSSPSMSSSSSRVPAPRWDN